MANMKNKPGEVKGDKAGKKVSSSNGKLSDGKAKGNPEYNNTGGDRKKNRQINPNESRIMGNPHTELDRESEEGNAKTRRRDNSL